NLQGNQKLGTRYPLNHHSSLYRRQEVVAVPPVATSILEGPYLPPANAENELFIGPHGVPNPLHHGYPLFPGSNLLHAHPGFPHAGIHGYYPHPASYHRTIPWGLRHGYHTHWPHMQASGPVFLADPNDGMYQEPVTGTLIPRPIIPPQYPGFMSHAADVHGYYNSGPAFLGGHGVYPIDTTMVEDQILDNTGNLHSSPMEDVAERMEEIRKETELERQKLIKAMKSKSTSKKVTKP
ncbi:uncharacterized protein LOC144659256, partial [Oculina patagonica]